ncbi:MAG: Gfo/Idh/MocA family oxidoreductase [Planctomycetes bacterium]|nr:Gfo/Idh/MocA family oxidoreductase [Planctomycetota bacterium]
MNLSPEEKQIGKQNFDEAVGTTRRDFLKGSVLAAGVAGTAGLGAAYFHYTPLSVDQRLRVGIIGTGDEGGVLIGALNPAYIDVVAIADIRPYSRYRAFHGDWYSPGAHAARPGLLEVYKEEEWAADEEKARKHVKVYENGYAELLDDQNVEAVIIALPLHLHHPASIAAMRKGKHVLTEKLMGHDVAQCKEMARVAKETGLILAVGHQRHYSILYDNAVEQIKQGLIGDIHHIRAQWHRGNLPGNDSWQPPLPEAYEGYAAFVAEIKRLEKAKDRRGRDLYAREHPLYAQLMSWEGALKKAEADPEKAGLVEWQKKVEQTRRQMDDVAIKDEVGPKYGYESKMLKLSGKEYERTPLEELIRWRLWDRTGGGLMAELGSHQLDASSIFISADHNTGHKVKPLSVTGVGGRHIFPADRDCDDHVYCMFEFPGKGYYDDDGKTIKDKEKKIVVTYSSINGNGYGGYGETVFGTKGTLILEQEQDAMLFKGSATTTRIEVKPTGPGKAAMDTYETGGGAAVAQAATAGNTSRGYREEIEHWAWCIKNPDPANKPRCTPEVAMADAIIALTSNMAIKDSKRIEFDEAWFDVDRSETPEGKAPREAAQIT